MAYLGILEGIKEYLLMQGLTKKELPKKVEEFRKAQQKDLGKRFLASVQDALNKIQVNPLLIQ